MNKMLVSVIGILAVIIAVSMLYYIDNPVFFDIFGLIVFTFLFITGISMLKSKEKMPDWVGFIILIIGVLGLIVDGVMVFKEYILG